MDTISDLSSTQEYSDIDLEGDSREIEAGSPGDVSMVAAVEVRKLAAAGISGAAAGHRSSRSVCGSDGELPPSPHGLSPGCSHPTSPSSAASSSMNSPQPQVCACVYFTYLFYEYICIKGRAGPPLCMCAIDPSCKHLFIVQNAISSQSKVISQ